MHATRVFITLAYATVFLLLHGCQGPATAEESKAEDSSAREMLETKAKDVSAAAGKVAEKAIRGMGDVKLDLDALIKDLDTQLSAIQSEMKEATGDAKAKLETDMQKVKAAQNRIAERMASVSVSGTDKATMIEELTSMVNEIRNDLGLGADNAESGATEK